MPALCVLDTRNCSCVSKPWCCIDPESTNSHPSFGAVCLFVGKGRAVLRAGCEWDSVVSRGTVHIRDPAALTLRQVLTQAEGLMPQK